ncbi:CatB-related O-acetyltransferase [Vibrio maritimus]
MNNRKVILSLQQRIELRKLNISLSSRHYWGRISAYKRPTKIEENCIFPKSKYIWEMGAFSYSHSTLPNYAKVGRYCSIAKGLEVFGSKHPIDCLTTSPVSHSSMFGINKGHILINQLDEENALNIGHDVWIGQNVTLKPGIHIGNGAVIAANSVVTKDVPDYAIVGGVPAQFIRTRFDEQTIERLNQSKWWEYRYIDFPKQVFKGSIDDSLTLLEEEFKNQRLKKFIPRVIII